MEQYSKALDMEDKAESHYLFQKYSDKDSQWSRGIHCDTLEEALQEQKDYYTMREGTKWAKNTTRILLVNVSTTHQCLTQ